MQRQTMIFDWPKYCCKAINVRYIPNQLRDNLGITSNFCTLIKTFDGLNKAFNQPKEVPCLPITRYLEYLEYLDGYQNPDGGHYCLETMTSLTYNKM